MNRTVKALIITAVIAAIFWPKRSGAQPNPAPLPALVDDKLPVSSLQISNYDAIWDYKYEAGIWYTKRKTTTTWVNMKDNLSPENYALAVNRLVSFAKERNLY